MPVRKNEYPITINVFEEVEAATQQALRRLVHPREYAAMAGVTDRTVYRMMSEGKLATCLHNKVWHVVVSDNPDEDPNGFTARMVEGIREKATAYA